MRQDFGLHIDAQQGSFHIEGVRMNKEHLAQTGLSISDILISQGMKPSSHLEVAALLP